MYRLPGKFDIAVAVRGARRSSLSAVGCRAAAGARAATTDLFTFQWRTLHATTASGDNCVLKMKTSRRSDVDDNDQPLAHYAAKYAIKTNIQFIITFLPHTIGLWAPNNRRRASWRRFSIIFKTLSF